MYGILEVQVFKADLDLRLKPETMNDDITTI